MTAVKVNFETQLVPTQKAASVTITLSIRAARVLHSLSGNVLGSKDTVRGYTDEVFRALGEALGNSVTLFDECARAAVGSTARVESIPDPAPPKENLQQGQNIGQAAAGQQIAGGNGVGLTLADLKEAMKREQEAKANQANAQRHNVPRPVSGYVPRRYF